MPECDANAQSDNAYADIVRRTTPGYINTIGVGSGTNGPWSQNAGITHWQATPTFGITHAQNAASSSYTAAELTST